MIVYADYVLLFLYLQKAIASQSQSSLSCQIPQQSVVRTFYADYYLKQLFIDLFIILYRIFNFILTYSCKIYYKNVKNMVIKYTYDGFYENAVQATYLCSMYIN